MSSSGFKFFFFTVDSYCILSCFTRYTYITKYIYTIFNTIVSNYNCLNHLCQIKDQTAVNHLGIYSSLAEDCFVFKPKFPQALQVPFC